jgi:hypothetical protein
MCFEKLCKYCDIKRPVISSNENEIGDIFSVNVLYLV